MERSDEVEAVVLRLYEAMRHADLNVIDGLIAKEDVLFVGTDAGEWWKHRPSMLEAFRDQMETAGGFDILDASPIGYAEADVGWFADQPVMRLPDGSGLNMRHTGVLHRVEGEWLFVHSHLSVGADINEELLRRG